MRRPFDWVSTISIWSSYGEKIPKVNSVVLSTATDPSQINTPPLAVNKMCCRKERQVHKRSIFYAATVQQTSNAEEPSKAPDSGEGISKSANSVGGPASFFLYSSGGAGMANTAHTTRARTHSRACIINPLFLKGNFFVSFLFHSQGKAIHPPLLFKPSSFGRTFGAFEFALPVLGSAKNFKSTWKVKTVRVKRHYQ